MALKLYIAYGTAAEQVTALRLQALGAVNGVNVYVPPAYTRQTSSQALDIPSTVNLESADAVLGVITTPMSETCSQELYLAKSLGKSTIVMTAPAFASALEEHFPGNVVVVNPADPTQAETLIVQFLKNTEMAQNTRKALIAFGTLTLGLLLLAHQD